MLFYLTDKIKIVNHKKIKLVSDKEIIVGCNKITYKIVGESLRLVYYSKEELILNGKAMRIEILYE